jgi:hypothetical protein
MHVRYASTIVIIISLADSAQHHTKPLYQTRVQLFAFGPVSVRPAESFVLSFARLFLSLFLSLISCDGVLAVRAFSITKSDIFDSVPLRCDRSASPAD